MSKAKRGGLATILIVAVALLVWFVVIPVPRGLGTSAPEASAVMQQRIREAREAGDSLVIRHTWVPLSEISPQLRRAVIVAEDYRFQQHRGVDWVSLAEEVRWTGDDDFSWKSSADLRALAAALHYAWKNRHDLRGRSTLTQQLAKNLYFGTDRSFVRKAVELVVARRLEQRLDKDRILELYLNFAEWGPGIFGAEAAAQTYYGRSAAELTLRQAAELAGTLPHPLTSNPRMSPGRMQWRRDLILARLSPSTGRMPEPMPLPEPRLALPQAEFVAPPQIAPGPGGGATDSTKAAPGAVPDSSGRGPGDGTRDGGEADSAGARASGGPTSGGGGTLLDRVGGRPELA